MSMTPLFHVYHTSVWLSMMLFCLTLTIAITHKKCNQYFPGICEPPSITSGSINPYRDVHVDGDRVTYSCSDGYHRVGSLQSDCASDGYWDSTLPTCKS